MLEDMAVEQKNYLLRLLEREKANEASRTRILQEVDDAETMASVEAKFELERSRATRMIQAVTAEQEMDLLDAMACFGLVPTE